MCLRNFILTLQSEGEFGHAKDSFSVTSRINEG